MPSDLYGLGSEGVVIPSMKRLDLFEAGPPREEDSAGHFIPLNAAGIPGPIGVVDT